MKKTVLRYGGWSAALLLLISYGAYFLGRVTNTSYAQSEALGYISMALSMIFVFLGIRHYRDKENGGYITYGQAFKLGILIVLIPSIAFGIFDVIYVKYLDPGFMEKYYDAMVVKMKAQLPPAEFERKLREMEKEKAMFSNLFVQFIIMSLTVLLVGISATAISALILKRKPKTA
jgi:hypothetical protein